MSHTPPRNPRAENAGKKILKFGCLPAFLLLVALIALGSALDDGDDKADAKPSASAPSKPADTGPAPSKSPGLSKHEITKLSVDMVWDGYSEARRDLLCDGVKTNGPGWFADQLESDNLDRKYAGQLVEEKCAAR